MDETWEIIKKILDYNKEAQKIFHCTSKVDKGKSKPKIEESIVERIKLKRQKLDIIVKKKENISNVLFNYYFNYSNPDIMLKRLRNASDEKSKNLVESINKKLN